MLSAILSALAKVGSVIVKGIMSIGKLAPLVAKGTTSIATKLGLSAAASKAIGATAGAVAAAGIQKGIDLATNATIEKLPKGKVVGNAIDTLAMYKIMKGALK